MDMRNRQQSRRNKSTDTEEGDPRCLLCSYYDDFIACFSCPLRRLYCLFLMSITETLLPISHLHYGDYCLIFISLGPDNLNKIGIFRDEGVGYDRIALRRSRNRNRIFSYLIPVLPTGTGIFEDNSGSGSTGTGIF